MHSQNSINNQVDSVSYLIGSSFGKNLMENMPEANFELMIKGIEDQLKGDELLIDQQLEFIISEYFQAKVDEEGQIFKIIGEQYLDSIEKSNPKIIKTSSGLMYEVLISSKGKRKPIETDMVRVHYKGSTPSGEVFDSSYDRGEPIDFTLNQVIKGWTEGVQLMTVGSKYRFYIPQDLAYGEMAPPGSVIKPFMPLVFEVELIDIIK